VGLDWICLFGQRHDLLAGFVGLMSPYLQETISTFFLSFSLLSLFLSLFIYFSFFLFCV